MKASGSVTLMNWRFATTFACDFPFTLILSKQVILHATS